MSLGRLHKKFTAFVKSHIVGNIEPDIEKNYGPIIDRITERTGYEREQVFQAMTAIELQHTNYGVDPLLGNSYMDIERCVKSIIEKNSHASSDKATPDKTAPSSSILTYIIKS